MATASERNEGEDSIGNTRDQTTQDFLTGLKERESLKQELSEREKDLVAVKSQNYDLIKRVEALEKEVRSSYELTDLNIFRGKSMQLA